VSEVSNDAVELFLNLTPDRVLEAVERAGLATNPICYPLNSFENRVYEVELRAGDRVVAKFYRPGRWSAEQILEEHRFLAELAAEEIPVCTAMPFPDRSTLHRLDNIYYSVAERRGGRAPDELSDDLVLRLGMLTARLHNVGAQRDAPSRWRLGSALWIREPLDWLERHDVVPPSYWPRYRAAALAIADAADRTLQGVPTHRIHGDLHLGNVLLRDGALRVLDFDDMCIGPAVQDLWLALPARDAEAWRQRGIWIKGYEHFRVFDRTTLRLIEPLRGMRIVHYAAWLARRYHDPAFQQAWPEFGSDEYWRNEMRGLEDQVQHLGDGPPRGFGETAPIEGESAPEELLSNEDYFWDWEAD
jgi:Ser/Thr protein kinase RdoA (MazF antagonist)